MSYDIFGDLHGHAEALKSLLKKMGYSIVNGAYKHPKNIAIFIGDFIDRGPNQLETVSIVKSMVDSGYALAIMGNHELNALAWYYKDSNGEHLRSHKKHNNDQHEQFLNEIGPNNDLHKETLDWFITLPLWLDLPGFRAVHACWDQASIDFLNGQLDSKQCLSIEQLEKATKKPIVEDGSMTMFSAVETILKGIERPLPKGITFKDAEGQERSNVRVKWWKINATTIREVALAEPLVLDKIPYIPYESNTPQYRGKPVFFGHYWMKGEPIALSNNIACVDYSVAKNGKLTAYRWRGESALNNQNFCQQD